MEELELHIFDFDGTLFRSPDAPSIWSGKDWWSDISSLTEPFVPEIPGDDWWINSTVDLAKSSISNPKVLAIMMTGRKDNSGFRYRIPELLSQRGLHFDMVKLCKSGEASKEKMSNVMAILLKNPKIKKIKAWDDKVSDLNKFKDLAIKMGIEEDNIEINQVSEAPKKISYTLNKESFVRDIILIANSLDKNGLRKEADELDSILEKIAYDNAALDRWFKEKWVDISRKVKGKHPPCGRPDADTGKYPKCRPAKRVNKKTPKTTKELSSSEKKKAITEKRKTERKPSESAGGGARKPKIAPALKRRK